MSHEILKPGTGTERSETPINKPRTGAYRPGSLGEQATATEPIRDRPAFTPEGKDVEKRRKELDEELKKLERKYERQALSFDEYAVSRESLAIQKATLEGIPEDVAKQFANRWFLKTKIGEGGMSTVFEADHISLGKNVLKFLTPLKDPQGRPIQFGEKQLTRLKNEGLALAQINHPNVAAVYDQGGNEKARWLAIQRVEGKNLDDYLYEQKGPLPVKRAVEIFLQTARGLEAAHKKGIIHRDIKPANILLADPAKEGPEGYVKLIDFGLSSEPETDADNKLLQGSSRRKGVLIPVKESGIFGTPLYMSPEQATAQEITNKSDIFSLGTTICKALTDRDPFEAEDVAKTLMKIVAEIPESPKKINSQVPERLNALLEKMMSKKPADRPEIGQVVKELEVIAKEK